MFIYIRENGSPLVIPMQTEELVEVAGPTTVIWADTKGRSHNLTSSHRDGFQVFSFHGYGSYSFLFPYGPATYLHIKPLGETPLLVVEYAGLNFVFNNSNEASPTQLTVWDHLSGT